MNSKILKASFLLFVITGVFASFAFLPSTYTKGISLSSQVKAVSSECPAGMSDQDCLEYLRRQAENVNKEISDLKKRLDKEKYDQLSLYDKIDYKRAIISQKESEITQLEIQIEQKNVEVRILLREIESLQSDIDIASQEIETLQNSLKDRVQQTYKYNRVSPLEIFISGSDLDELSRKIQYLQKTREKDQELLDSMSSQVAELNQQQQVLSEKKFDVQTKRNEVETQKTQIYSERETLVAEQANLSYLLSQSKANEEQYMTKLEANLVAQNALDAAIIEQINSMVKDADFQNGDYVPAGATIGYMGNTGYSFGAHLHFSYGGQAGYYCNGTINPFSSGYLVKGPDIYATSASGFVYYYVHSGSKIAPSQSPAIMTQTFHQGYAIDLWHQRASDSSYNVKIYASHSGRILRYTDYYGGKYAIIRGDDGLTSCYLHLK